jgi:1-aminocyclopropane-1-carboxylate deaminase
LIYCLWIQIINVIFAVLYYHATPQQIIIDFVLEKAGIQLIVKREDLNHPFISGNKWWKLKYNLQKAIRSGQETVLTFGGAYSNHIYATAAAAKEVGLKSIGIIRGEETLPLNPTLTFAREQGMSLHYVTRENYRAKTNPVFIKQLHEKFGNFYLIPEGGTNELALQGCAEFATQKLGRDFDYLCLPAGTGGTIAGIIAGLEGEKEIIGVSVLKNGDFLRDDITQLVRSFSGKNYGNWSLLTSYDHGGYAKVTGSLLDFIAMMKVLHNLPLDPLYTGKLLWAVMKEAEHGTFKRGSTVLALHTGGLQGATAIHP